jgi:hypothetical protein
MPWRTAPTTVTLVASTRPREAPVKAARGPLRLVQADVPVPLYDPHRRVVVVPAGMDQAQQVEAMYELMRERRDLVPRFA